MRSECRRISPVLPALLVSTHELAFELDEPHRLQAADEYAAQRSRRREYTSDVGVRREGRVVEGQCQRAFRNDTCSITRGAEVR